MYHIHSSMMCVYILGSLAQIHMHTYIIFVLFELVKQYLAPKTSKIIRLCPEVIPEGSGIVLPKSPGVAHCHWFATLLGHRQVRPDYWPLRASTWGCNITTSNGMIRFTEMVATGEYAVDMIRWYKTFQFSDVCTTTYDLNVAVYMYKDIYTVS